MAEISQSDCRILGSFPNAPSRSWTEVLTEQDRNVYRHVYKTLKTIGETAATKYPGELRSFATSGFHETSGIRNTRPKDLWCSVVNEGGEAFVGMPQIFMIASERGIEVGLAAAIHPSDFSSQDVKNRLRRIIPILFDLFPDANSAVISQMDENLRRQGNWFFQRKARLNASQRDYASFSEMIADLKTESGRRWGAGAVSRYISPQELDKSTLSLDQIFQETVATFIPFMRAIKGRYAFGEDLAVMDDLLASVNADTAEAIGSFNPNDVTDGRRKILSNITLRQGQGLFRIKLLEAYNKKCAVTGSTVSAILEAAHIVPYDGVQTNHITNGILLRSDIHTLFDLGLLKISPTYEIIISGLIRDPEYRQLHGKVISLPVQRELWPSVACLKWHRENG